MCGRLAVYNPKTKGSLELLGHTIPPNYNAAPSEHLPIIRLDENQEPELVMARWGLMPGWATDPVKTKPFFNARVDNLEGNKVFWSSRDRHCLVPAAGFYEWSEHDKQPYYIHPDTDRLFYMAGLWRRWEAKEQWLDSFTIITTKSHPSLADIHDRSPVILSSKQERLTWVSKPYDFSAYLLTVYDAGLAKYPVSKAMNNARNKSADCIAPVNQAV